MTVLTSVGISPPSSAGLAVLTEVGDRNLTAALNLSPASGGRATLGPVVRLLAIAVALLVGVGLGVIGDRLLVDDEAGPRLRGGGTLRALPDAPVEVRAESVLLPTGFRSRHVHGGPTFNAVRSGEVEIEDQSGTTVYGAGQLFFEPADVPHAIHVLSEARLDVVRLLPPGAAATTEVR
jgi:hypothetical protein